jgi:putative ABC transport system permease protein
LPLAKTGAREFLAIAAEALGRYKLRTSLSVLGVVLGVAAVIAMMSVSEGARREALLQVEAMGLDNLVVRNRGAVAGAPAAHSSGLKASDARRLLALVPWASAASPLQERYLTVSRAGTRLSARIVGVSPAYQTILRLGVGRGRFLSPLDERNVERVCVLGGGLARMLFGYADPVGQTIRIDADYYQVIGVLAERTAAPQVGALAWRDINQAIIAPLSTVLGRSVEVAPEQAVSEIWIQTSAGDRVEEIGRILQHTLTRLHGADDAEVVVPRELLNQRFRTQRTFSVVVGSVAVLALIVGGIGIMNIMLTSVVERTHEIGIRRTVGATRKDVATQFLTESLLMTISGGAIGILLGALVSWSITVYAGWSTYISALAVLLAFTVSVAVGLGFGLYPAIRAAELEPVDAVRYE